MLFGLDWFPPESLDVIDLASTIGLYGPASLYDDPGVIAHVV